MPILDPLKARLEALKARAARLLQSGQAPSLIIIAPGETRDQAVARVCGEKGLPRVMMNGRPLPTLFIRGVTPPKSSLMEDG